MLPEKFLERMEKMLGDEYPAFLESFDRENHRALRINKRKVQAEEFVKSSPCSLRPVPWTENGFYYENGAQPGKHPYHEAGVYYIQEPSAMSVVPFLEAKSGERILDLCAAPGGKSTQIADEMRGEGILVCNEIHPQRAKILAENIERMGVINAIVTNETPAHLAEMFPCYFDKILVDAPCSGEGMFRKNADAVAEWSEENVLLCADRQDEVLSCAARMLRPGGRIVYSTCTFAPAENEGTISRFVKENSDFMIVSTEKPMGFVSGVAAWIENPADGIERTMRLMPHKVEGEGHFLAVLERTGEIPAFVRGSKNGLEKNLPAKDYVSYTGFANEVLLEFEKEGTYLTFGEQLYLGPVDMPALKGLKVLRPGLHLGTFKKNRFEPSHALALALAKKQVAQYVDLSSDSRAVGQYLGGQTLILGEEGMRVRSGKSGEEIENAKGWCLICVDGYSLGWSKLAGSVLKNHYPKGLRKF